MGGYDVHPGKEATNSEHSGGATVTSSLGRSEKWTQDLVLGHQEIVHYVSDGTFMSWITATR